MKFRLRAGFPCCLTALLLAAAPRGALACAVCFGQSDSELARGMNWGVFVLLLVVLGVLATVASFFVFLARRSVQASAPAPRPAASDPHRA
jgi:hypothetical protein